MGQPWTNLRWSDLQHARQGRRGRAGKELARRCSAQVSSRDAGKQPTQCCCALGTASTGSGREPPPRAPPGTAAPGSTQRRLPRSAGKGTTFARSARGKRKERVASGQIRSGGQGAVPRFGRDLECVVRRRAEELESRGSLQNPRQRERAGVR
jgi:hypothetical protein